MGVSIYFYFLKFKKNDKMKNSNNKDKKDLVVVGAGDVVYKVREGCEKMTWTGLIEKKPFNYVLGKCDEKTLADIYAADINAHKFIEKNK